MLIMKKLLAGMTKDINSNIKKIKKEFGVLEYKDIDNQSLLHIFVDNKYDETKCFLAIKSLLQVGLSPNLEADFNYNFIQTALYTGYSEDFILNIITESLKYNLNVNHVDSEGDTIMHTVIYSDEYLGKIERIYELLCANGYDSTRVCSKERNLVEAMRYQRQYTPEQIERFENLFNEKTNGIFKKNEQEQVSTINVAPATLGTAFPMIQTLSEKEIKELEKYGKILNKKNYLTPPTVGREKELKNIMITLAQDKKRPIIVGETGVGKTVLVDELAFRIKTNQVPNFLQGRIILEVNPSDIVAGCRYVGMFEENMTKLMKLCEKYDVIIFIDEIHTIYGVGSSTGKDNDMASMLKYYIDRANLKVMGTTTENEYNKFFGADALKRRFEKITVKEPTEDFLYKIVNKVIGDYYVKNSISFEDDDIRKQVVSIILKATEKSHRVYNDVVNNPDLAISIVDKAFAFAKIYDSEFITIEHFIESFEYCDRIYDSAKERAIARLRSINNNNNVSKPASKVLKIDSNKFRK